MYIYVNGAIYDLWCRHKNSPGLQPMACQIADIVLFHWISFLIVLVLGFRFPMFLGTDHARHTRGAPGPIPKQTTPVGEGRTPVGACRTPRDMNLKIALVFKQFFFRFRSSFCSQIVPKPEKKHFLNRSRF